MSDQVEKVSAGWMGRSFERDIDLNLPERPRLIPELLVIPLGKDGLLVFGGERSQVLRGRSARTLLPRLLPLLDGVRSVRDIAEAARIPLRHARDAVSLLASRDLLEDGVPAPSSNFPDVRSFLGRFINVSGVNKNREQAFGKIAESHVRVVGPSELAGSLENQFRETGIGEVVTGWNNQATSDLTVLITTGDDQQHNASLRRAWASGERVLLVRLGASESHVGPFVQRGESVCPDCFTRMHPHPVGAPDADVASYLLGLTGVQVVTLVSKVALGGSQRAFRAFLTDPKLGLVTDLRIAPRLPGCQACGLGGKPLAPDDPLLLPWLYHSGTVMETRELLAPKDYQGHYAITNLKLAFEEEVKLQGATALDLPPHTPLTQEPFWASSVPTGTDGLPLELSRLNELLAWTAGELKVAGESRRILPSGGNLGSVDLWLLVRDVKGLLPGAYHYRPRTHQLEQCGTNIDDARLAAALGVTASSLPSLIILGTGALRKVMKKYQAFGYRLCFLDSGVALSYLHTVGSALGLSIAEYPEVNDRRILSCVGVPARWEHPIATFALGFSGVKFSSESAPASREPNVELPPLRPSDCSTDVLPRLCEHGWMATFPAPVSDPQPSRRPRMDPLLRSLDEILTNRRSVRRWKPEPVDGGLLAQIAAIALEGMRRREGNGGPPCFVRPVLAVARGGKGLIEGLYEVEADGSGLRRRSEFDVQMMRAIMFQAALAKAPAALIFVGNLDEALCKRGLRGYRELAQYAGTGAGQAWLAAVSHGIGAVAAGGLMAGELRRAAGMDGYTECAILTLNLGIPKPWPIGTPSA